MFKYRATEIEVSVDDVIAFIDLMHRWSFQTAFKFAYEFYQGNLILSWVNAYVPSKDPYVLLSHKTKGHYEQN